MLICFDESFRKFVTQPEKSLGILCGVAISEKQMYRVAADVFQLKLKHLGAQYAREKEIKGKELLKPYTFKLKAKGVASKNLALASDLLDYVVSKNLAIFGCVCFEDGLRAFRCEDVRALDKTFRRNKNGLDDSCESIARQESLTSNPKLCNLSANGGSH
jgi:hypothetical protein